MNLHELVAGRFKIERLAGSGGMGAVYRAADEHTGEPVALKVLRTHKAGAGIERFQREARFLAELGSPGIVRYVAHGYTREGALFLAMEWLEGEDLGRRLKRGPLGLEEAQRFALRVAETLAIVHARGVIHRDVKPSNLFLVGGELDRVKLLDFGLARLGLGVRPETRPGTALGTPGYMAPEQARGTTPVDARVDVYSLGCVLHQCVGGKPVFVGEHVMALLARVLLEEPVRLAELDPAVPAALDDLVARMLAKDPEQRPPDAGAVAAELRAIRSSEGAAAAPSAPRKPPALGSDEQRFLCVVMAAGGGHLLTSGEVSGSAATPPPPAPSAPSTSTPPSDAQASGPTTRDSLDIALRRLGGRTELLADGTLVCTFEGPGAPTDVATRAARCALEVREAFGDVSIAVASGRGVVAGRWPVGEVIDRAARQLRQEQGHRPTIVIDDATAALLGDRFPVSKRDALWELSPPASVQIGGEPGPLAGVLGRPTPFVGRETELDSLTRAFEAAARDGTAGAVVVVGAAGVGKSRLRAELVRWLAAEHPDVPCWMARGAPLGTGAVYGLAGQIVRHAAGLPATGPANAEARARIIALAEQAGVADALRVAEFLGELGNVPFRDEGRVQLRAARQDPVLMGDQLRAAWEEWLSAELARRPVLLVLEDLHFGDRPTVKLVESSLRRLAERPLCVLAFARPEVRDLHPDLFEASGGRTLRVGELRRRPCERLIRQVLGEVPAELAERLIAQSGGNAFYLEELMRAVAEGRGDDLPGTVLAMVQARLDGLDAETRRLLRGASVFGEAFTAEGAAALVGGDAGARLPDLLASLVDRELVFRRDDHYRFRAAMVREAAYSLLTDADRRLGHRLAGGFLEQHGGAPAAIAEHFERGGEPGRAVTHWRRAAELALEANDLAGVLAHADRAFAAGTLDSDDAADLRRLEADVAAWSGDMARAERAAREAWAHARRGTPSWFRAGATYVKTLAWLSLADRLDAVVPELFAAADAETLASDEVVTALAGVVVQLYNAGRYELAGATLGMLDAELDRRPVSPMARARVLDAHAYAAGAGGDQGAALGLISRAVEHYEEAGDRRSACNDRINLGYTFLQLGDFAEALHVLRDALAAAERLSLRALIPVAQQNLALAAARCGRRDEALALLRAAIAEFRAQRDPRMEGFARVYLALMLLDGPSPDAAEATVQAAEACANTADAPPALTYALAAAARALRAAGRAAEAGLAARRAAELLFGLGGLDEGEALVRLEHAATLEADGDRAAAARVIADGRRRLVDRADDIADPALRRSFLERVPENAELLRLAVERDIK